MLCVLGLLGNTDGFVHLALTFVRFDRLFGQDVGQLRDLDLGERAAEAEDACPSRVDNPNVDVF